MITECLIVSSQKINPVLKNEYYRGVNITEVCRLWNIENRVQMLHKEGVWGSGGNRSHTSPGHPVTAPGVAAEPR